MLQWSPEIEGGSRSAGSIECSRGLNDRHMSCKSQLVVKSIICALPHSPKSVLHCCSVLQRVAVCCSVLKRVAVCCSVLQCESSRGFGHK